MWSAGKAPTTKQPLPIQSRLPEVTPEMRKAMVDTTRLPKPISRAYVWSVTLGGTFFCFALAMFTQWLLYQHWHFHAFHGFRWGTSLVMVPAVAIMLRLLMYQEQRRRQAIINRFMAVAEANHHIRNALTVLVAANYLQGEERRKIAVIQEAIERIEHTLAEVLPQVQDERNFWFRRTCPAEGAYSSSSSGAPRAALDAVMIFSCNCAGTMS